MIFFLYWLPQMGKLLTPAEKEFRQSRPMSKLKLQIVNVSKKITIRATSFNVRLNSAS